MRKALIALAIFLNAGAAGGQQRQPTTSDPALATREAAILAEFARLPDTGGTGPYKAVRDLDPALPKHVIYRPRDLAALGGKKLGVIIWGNGGCGDDGASARLHLAELASHGYVVIAPGSVLSGPGAPPARKSQPAGLGVKTTTAQVIAGLDWALAENSRKGSRYDGRIDPRLVGASGHSCGGLQALQAAADPRIHAVIIHNSGIFADGSNPIAGLTVDKSLLLKLHTPVIYILGGPADVAYPNGTDDFHKIEHVPAMLVNLPVGHGGTLREPNGGPIAQVAVKWFEWQLRGDKAAAKTFVGPDCTLCTDKKWTVERKRI